MKHFFTIFDFDQELISLGVNVHSSSLVSMRQQDGKPNALNVTVLENGSTLGEKDVIETVMKKDNSSRVIRNSRGNEKQNSTITKLSLDKKVLSQDTMSIVSAVLNDDSNYAITQISNQTSSQVANQTAIPVPSIANSTTAFVSKTSSVK